MIGVAWREDNAPRIIIPIVIAPVTIMHECNSLAADLSSILIHAPAISVYKV